MIHSFDISFSIFAAFLSLLQHLLRLFTSLNLTKMDKKRYESGSQKRKNAKDKERKHNELLEKIPKLSAMFGGTATATATAASAIESANLSESESETMDEVAAETETARASMRNMTGPEENNSDWQLGNIGEIGEAEETETDPNQFDDDTDADTVNDMGVELDQNVSSSSLLQSEQLSNCSAPFSNDAALWKMNEDISSLQSFWSNNGLF